MKAKSTITIFLVLLMTSSIFVVNTATPTTTDAMPRNLETPQARQTIAEAPSISPPHILVYTEFTNVSENGEYDRTMSAINETYGTDYQQTNLTSYLDLSIQLPGKDILLIPEQENANVTHMKQVGSLWAGMLVPWVSDGGVVVMLDFGNYSSPGLGLHIYNQSGLMSFGPVLGQYPSPALQEMHRHTFGDALSRRVEYRWTPRNHTFAVQTTDGVVAFDDYDTDSPVCVHKSMGKGHVVFLGFDMSDADANYEQIVGNSIRFTNYVIIDDAQDTEAKWEFEPPHSEQFLFGSWVHEMVEAGFAVGRMDNIVNATLLAAAEAFICPLPYYPTDDYDAAEIAIINDYVTNGGSVFLFSDFGSYGDDIRALVSSFGYESGDTYLYDTDNYVTSDESRIYYEGSNILSHPITTGVSRVEMYASDGFTTLPGGAEILIQSDFDNTTFWNTGDVNADGVATMAVSHHGEGKVAVCLDTNIFFANDTIDGNTDGDSLDNFYDSDNDVLLMNTVNWLAMDDITNTPPEISGVSHSPLVPMNGITVNIDATIVDSDGIDNATCYYRVDMGSWTTVTMINDIGDSFYATIGSFEEKQVVDYYVRAFDNSADSLEAVSSIGSFEVYNHLPDIPVLNDPGDLDDDGIFLLNWTESHDEDGYVDHYEVQMDDVGDFASVLDHWTVETNETWVNIFENGTYFFRVKALDDHGEYAGFSNVVSIEVGIPVDMLPPIIATLFTHPAEPIHGDSVTIKADVLDFSGIKNVTVIYRVNGGSWSALLMVNVFGDRYEKSIGSFVVDDFVEYFIEACDNTTQYNYAVSEIQSFHIENQAPLAPDLLDPGTQISVSHVILNWTESYDHEGELKNYQIQVSVSSEFTTIWGDWNSTDLSYNVTGLASGIYYFRVRAFDDHGAVSPWSDVESIEVILGTITPTSTTTATTSPTSPTDGSPFDPEILNLVFLAVSMGSLAIILIIVIAIVRQRSRTRSQYHF